MSQKMTLYYRPGACSLGPHIVLEWIGKEYAVQLAGRGEESFLKLNAADAVPVLVVPDGRALTQNGAILQYLAKTAERWDLLGSTDAFDQAEVARWCAFFTGDMHPAFFPLFGPARYTTSNELEDLEAVREAGKNLVRKQLSAIDAHLEGRRYFVGDGLTIVDAYSVPMLRWANNMLDRGLATWPNVAAHYKMMVADEGVMAVMGVQGIKP